MTITPHIDFALILLYAFWIFFFALVVYLNREGMREGFPAQSEITGRPLGGGLVGLPKPKTFKLEGGVEVQAPRPETYEEPANAKPVAPWSGAPLDPVGDPMLSEFGPAAYAQRMDTPALTHSGALKIAPMRDLADFSIVKPDQDPRGLPVIAADGAVAGTVADIWVDREESLIRYLEVELPGAETAPPPPSPEAQRPLTEFGADQGDASAQPAEPAPPPPPPPAARRVLLPMTMALVGGRLASIRIWRPEVRVRSITAAQFANVPTTRAPNQVTLLEEDRITAYYGGGTLYARPERREPLV